jgi:hypothetical protein
MAAPRQLSLFKGKRQRGVTLPPPKEFASHCVIADMVRRWITPQWRFTHLPMGELRDKATAARLARMGVTAGWPDFMFVGPPGVFFLELKRHKHGRLSDEQRDIAAHIMTCGLSYMCTDSVDDAIATMCDLGILRPGIHLQ